MDRDRSLCRRSHALLVALATIVLLAPFLAKPFHIDDPLYLWLAQHIRAHPLDYYGFDANWTGVTRSMAGTMNSPPLGSCFIALGSFVVGWSELGLHALFLLPAVGLALGTYVLASRFCRQPLLAALAAIVTPAFLVCSGSIMYDMPMTCLWVWAVIAWETGMRQRRWPALLAASLLIAAAALTKYFGLALVPLLLTYGVFVRRGVGWWTLWLLVPLAALAGYEWWTQHLYGRGLFSGIASYSADARANAPQGRGLALKGLAFTGGGMIIAALMGPWMWSRATLVFGVIACAGFAALSLRLRTWGSLHLVDNADPNWLVIAQAAVMIIAGASVLAAAVMDIWRRRDAASILLALWVLGTFCFATFLNWSVNERTLLAMLPAVAILGVRRMEDRACRSAAADSLTRARQDWRLALPLLASAAIALALACADASAARASREAARIAAALPRSPNAVLWFQGHWGWQHYLQLAGGKTMNLAEPKALPGDLIAIPLLGSNTLDLPADCVRLQQSFEMQPMRWVTVFDPRVGAGFHSSAYGPLPFVFGPVAPERYDVYEVTRFIR